jgi:transposase-like protein
MENNRCPNCGSNWDGGSIIESFIKQRSEGVNMWQGMSNADIEKFVTDTYSPPYRWLRLQGVVIQGGYDGISLFQCPDCKATWDRFTGKRVED